MNRGRIGEERGSKEMDGCPLTAGVVVKHTTNMITHAANAQSPTPHAHTTNAQTAEKSTWQIVNYAT
jgi:hypothetical protein